MITLEEARSFALSLDDVVEQPHFEKSSFRIKNKIFLTLDAERNRACVMLDPLQQSVFVLHDPQTIYAVPNSWGAAGATFVELEKVRKTVFRDAVRTAYKLKSAPKRK